MAITDFPIGSHVVSINNQGQLNSAGNPIGVGCVTGTVVNSALYKNLYQIPVAGLTIPSNSDLLEILWTSSANTVYVPWYALIKF
jgi:hypothetical protein